MRSEALSRQDVKTDDYADLEALQTKDSNFMKTSRKLHEKRRKDGVPITVRMDVSGNIARLEAIQFCITRWR